MCGAGHRNLFHMKQEMIERPIDVRRMQPRERHPTIFATWNELPADAAMLIINDHDPVPLYYQFAAEYTGQFHWDYVESGPTTWRVRITKGQFADPGFVPKRHAPVPVAVPLKFVEPLELDTRPIFARGETPCTAIDQAIASLIPGQKFVLLAPFDPVPLYAKLEKQGYGHRTEQVDAATWRIEFSPSARVTPSTEKVACCCSHPV